MNVQTPLSFAQFAIANGATTPVPTSGAGSIVWSTTTVSFAQWDGTSWKAVALTSVAPSTGTPTSVTVTTTSTALLTSLATRLGATFFNSGSVTVYIGLGFTPTTSSFSFEVPAGVLVEIPYAFTGAVNGITLSGSTTMQITSLS